MEKITELRVEEVRYIPPLCELEHGVLYVSTVFRGTNHLCPCGCGNEVYLPTSAGHWSLTMVDGRATLSPSISCVGFPCKSHYWIRDNKIVWA